MSYHHPSPILNNCITIVYWTHTFTFGWYIKCSKMESSYFKGNANSYKNRTWKFVDLPARKHVMRSKWVYNVYVEICLKWNKLTLPSKISSKGIDQSKGMNYLEMFSLVAKITLARVVLSSDDIVLRLLYQLDIKNDFLHGNL